MKDRNCQREAHEGLTKSIPQDLIHEWERICKTWEDAPYPKELADDGSKLLNPFAVKRECTFLFPYLCAPELTYAMAVLTQAQVEMELAMEDDIMAQKGVPLRNRTRPGKFILMGLDVEESQ